MAELAAALTSMSTVAKMILESMDEEEQLLVSLLAKERRKRR